MITVRKSQERGHFDFGWLDTYHSFSFGEYHDPAHVQFRALRVINEDHVQPGRGFGAHPHRDMEIITYVLDGALQHEDSLGHGAILRPGKVQRISAGSGIHHSEFNASRETPVHLLQIWLLPHRRGLTPGYGQRAFDRASLRGRLRLVVSGDGRDGSLTMNQDADLYAAILAPGETVAHALAAGRHAWVQVARGDVTLNGAALHAGDGAAVSDEGAVQLAAQSDAEVLLFDLA